MTCKVPAECSIIVVKQCSCKQGHKERKRTQFFFNKGVFSTSNEVFFCGYISVMISNVNLPLGGETRVKWCESKRKSPSWNERQVKKDEVQRQNKNRPENLTSQKFHILWQMNWNFPNSLYQVGNKHRPAIRTSIKVALQSLWSIKKGKLCEDIVHITYLQLLLVDINWNQLQIFPI